MDIQIIFVYCLCNTKALQQYAFDLPEHATITGDKAYKTNAMKTSCKNLTYT